MLGSFLLVQNACFVTQVDDQTLIVQRSVLNRRVSGKHEDFQDRLLPEREE